MDKEKTQPYENVKRSKRAIIFNNFLGGISWALGATVGLSIVIAIITFVGKHINFIPIVGNFVAQISDYVVNNAHR